jgi:hypothetical protein
MDGRGDKRSNAGGARAIGLAVVLAAAWPALAKAQQPTAPEPSARPAPADAIDATVSEVVVNASKLPYAVQPGAVVGDIQPDIQLDPAQVQSYGVSTVNDLINELAPQTASSRGRGGETPVVLLNGKRISGFGEVRDIPTEAILRVDILPEEVGLKYGFTADQKVINVVLRPRFRSLTGEANAGGPTAGGQINGSLDANRFSVRDDDRVNIDLKVSGNSDITYAARGLSGASQGPPFALQGNVVAGSGRGPVDPALTALAGFPATVAAVPAAAASRAPTLAEFAAAAGGAHIDDLGRYRDLASANQNLSANMVIARALGGGYSGTLNASFTTGASQSLQGLPSLALGVPAASPWSPFGSDVRLYRYVDALGPLRQDATNWSGHLGATLNRQAGEWRFNLTAAYDHADTLIVTGSGVDPAALQSLLTAGSGTFNPYGPIPASMLTRLPNSEARSLSDSGNLQAVVYGPLVRVPAGQLRVSLKAGDSQSAFTSSAFRIGPQQPGVLQTAQLSRNDLSGQADLDLPLTSRRNKVLPWFGDLSINANLSIDQLSGFGAVQSLGYGLNWTPIQQVRLIVSETHDQAAPSVSQLGSPTVQTPGVPVYDYLTGQSVLVTTLSGANPDLAADRRNVFKVGLTVKPWSSENFTLTVNYVDQRTDEPIGGFPAATAGIEAAFPDRFLRDAAGELIALDQRPVNFAWTRRQDIRWGFNWSKAVGKAREPSDQGRGGQGQGAGLRRGAFRGGGQGRFQIAAYHTVYFYDQTLLRPGGPQLDFLKGAPSGRAGGQPVHSVEGQMGYSRNGLGFRINANWVEGTTVQGGGFGTVGALSFPDLTTVHLRLFVNFAQVPGVVRDHPWLGGSRLTLSLFNLFDQRLKVRDAAGRTPASYAPALLDPTGRQVAITFRKLVF